MAGLSKTMETIRAREGEDASWWEKVPPDQRDWWTRRLNSMPYAAGNFRDDIFKEPPDPAVRNSPDFDRNDIDPELLNMRRKLRSPRDTFMLRRPMK
jgi:hypothetical protein